MARTQLECAALFRGMSDPTRLWLIQRLARNDAVVSELSREAKRPPANVSHHLSILHGLRIVEAVREGKFKRYRLAKAFYDSFRHDNRGTFVKLGCCDVLFHPRKR